MVHRLSAIFIERKSFNFVLRQKFHSEYDFETHAGVGDNFLLDFEKFVSEQEVSFFSQKMDISMRFSCPIYKRILSNHMFITLINMCTFV